MTDIENKEPGDINNESPINENGRELDENLNPELPSEAKERVEKTL